MIVVLRWWLALAALGAVVYPLVWRLCRALPDRGITLARPLGLLAVSYGTWLLVSLGFLEHRLAGILFVVLLVGLASALIWRRDGREILAWFREHWRLVAATEGLFLVALALFAVFRAYNPEIAATEKPMEYAFLNGILRSRTFPPRDPWLAGYGISYYHLGYVMMAILTQLSGVAPGVAFNLTGVGLFALTVTGAFGLGYNLMAARTCRVRRAGSDESAVAAGGLTAVMMALMGNLVGVFELIRARGWGSLALWRWLDVRNLGPSTPSRYWYPDDMWWWWRASRVIHDRDLLGNSVEVISEFPFFSFLLGDNHPHVLALPFVLVALALALNLVLDERPGSVLGLRWPGGGAHLVAYGAIVGGLAFLNTWDYPIYLGIILLTYLLRGAPEDGPEARRRLGDAVKAAVALGALGLGLYLPFFLGFRSQAGGIGLVVGVKTRLHQHLLMFGPQVVWLAPALGALVWQMYRRGAEGSSRRLDLAFGLATIAWTVLCAALGWWTAWLSALLAGASLWCLFAWWTRPAVTGEVDGAMRLALAMVVTAGALVVFCEFFFLRDVFGTRMNTVFKFYYQAWVLLSVAAVHLAARGMQAWRPGTDLGRVVRAAAATVGVLAVVAGLSYTAAAIPSKAGGFVGTPTLDGTAFLEQVAPDEYATIIWLQTHAREDDVMLEAPGGSYTEFNRISAWTGVPTLLGWTGHQLQWRGSYEIPGQREPDIATIYQSADLEQTRAPLDVYGVDLVVVGPRERAKYGVGSVTMQKLDVLLERVYENPGYVVYGRGR